jgi:glycosyltransferase involved in cell wall biosynthesis
VGRISEGGQRRRIRVLVLVKGLGLGGTERLLVEAARARDCEQYEYEVAFLLPWKTALVPDFERSGIRTHCLTARGPRDISWASRLRDLLTARPFDILHAHSPYPAGIARLVTRTLPSALRPRVFTTEHNALKTYSLPTRALTVATSWIDDQRIAVSDYVANSFPDRRRVRVVVQGIMLEAVRDKRAERSAVRSELKVDPDQILVGTVANYVAQKDYPSFFEAARIVGERDTAVRFCAVGQGPLAAQIHALHAAMDLQCRVILLGAQQDAVRMMAGCDIFALASRFEGLPVALMEALALGLPIVATGVGGVPEAVRHGVEGLLVPPGRPELLADAIQQLATDRPLRLRMAAAASRRSATFDIVTAVRELEGMYRETMRGA